jgi:hypothetical protein
MPVAAGSTDDPNAQFNLRGTGRFLPSVSSASGTAPATTGPTIDFLTMHPDARRGAVRLIGEIDY